MYKKSCLPGTGRASRRHAGTCLAKRPWRPQPNRSHALKFGTVFPGNAGPRRQTPRFDRRGRLPQVCGRLMTGSSHSFDDCGGEKVPRKQRPHPPKPQALAHPLGQRSGLAARPLLPSYPSATPRTGPTLRQRAFHEHSRHGPIAKPLSSPQNGFKIVVSSTLTLFFIGGPISSQIGFCFVQLSSAAAARPGQHVDVPG